MTGSTTWRVGVLGRFAVTADGAPLRLSPGSARLVALLVVTGPRSRTDAAGTLWTDLPQPRANADLRTELWRTRRLAPGLVVEDGAVLHVPWQVDYLDAVAWARSTVMVAGAAAAAPDGALRELLPGWGEPWLVGPREELRQLQLHALDAEAQRSSLRGDLGRAFSSAQAAVGLDPLRESSTRLLVEILLREGNAVEAVRCYRRYRTLLDAELGTPPGDALTALVRPYLRPAGPTAQLI